MLKPSDFNNAVPQFQNGNYASNPENPQYVEEPDAESYNKGTEPLQTLPAQWWNWFMNKFTTRFNKVNVYVKNIFNELSQLLSLVSESPSGTEATPTIGQLKDMFENKYPNYLALLMYPVGSIYWTSKAPDDGGDPNVLFGGTWVQIKGKFVWAKGDGDTLNATGGEKTHTLTTSEIPSHNHSFTPAGSISVTTNPTFTGSEHSHTYTPAGSISITTNPTFTGNTSTTSVNNRGHTHSYSHTHGYTPSGKIASTSGGTDNKTAGMSAHSYGRFRMSWNSSATRGLVPYTDGITFKSSKLPEVVASGSSNYDEHSNLNNQVEMDISHTHEAYFNGSAGTTTSQSTTTTDGESQNHIHTIYPTGTISGGAYNFTGTQATTLKATAGGSISGGAYNFTGTGSTTGSKGDGGAHNNMPPYIVKYCWERTK